MLETTMDQSEGDFEKAKNSGKLSSSPTTATTTAASRRLLTSATSTTTQSLSQHSLLTMNTSYSRSGDLEADLQLEMPAKMSDDPLRMAALSDSQSGGRASRKPSSTPMKASGETANSRASGSHRSNSSKSKSSDKASSRSRWPEDELRVEKEERAEQRQPPPEKPSSFSVSSMKTIVHPDDFKEQWEHEQHLLRKKAQGESEGESPVTSTTDNNSHRSKSQSQSRSRRSKLNAFSKLNPLPWKDQDSENLRDQVAFWKNCLLEEEEDGLLPSETIRELLKTIYTLLRKDSFDRNDNLLAEISERLQSLELLDLETLVPIMAKHQEAGQALEGQDVILLSGAVGSGKTTTLHFLAGTEFKEVEVDGFIHYHPNKFSNNDVSDYKTACGREPVTKQLQLAQVELPASRHSIVVCDTPGPNHPQGLSIEEELAYKYVIGPAVDKAKRVKPVVVINNELMGSCFSNLPETLQMMTEQFDLKTGRDLRPIDYVFTHYEERHRTRLCQQFASLQKYIIATNASNEHASMDLLDDLINDMIKKTNPNANIVMPLDDDPRDLLQNLWKESFVEEPRDLFQYKASEISLKRLEWQLQITLDKFRVDLCRERYADALNCMILIDKLSAWFPEAREVAKHANEAASAHVKLVWDHLCQEIQDTNYEIALARMEQISDFGLIFRDASECCRNGHDLLWESLVAPMENKDYGLSIERIAKLSKLGNRYTEATGCVRRSLRLLRKKVESAVEQGDYMDAMNMMVQLSSLEMEIPEAGDCARHLLISLRSFLETVIERKDYTIAIKMIRKFSNLRDLYIEAGDFSNKGLVLIRKSVEKSMEQGDYDSATFLVRHMQQSQEEFEEAEEIANFGLHLFDKTMDGFVDKKDFRSAIPLMKQVIKDIPGSEEIVRKSLAKIRTALKGAIGIQDYETALELIYQVNNLAKVMPEADAFIEYGFNALEENILVSIDRQEYESAIHLLELLSLAENQLPLAKECTRVAVEVLKRNVSKAIEKKKFSPALNMIMELNNKGHRLPEVNECSRRGLEMLRSTAEAAIGQRDYETAIEIINNLSELTQSLPEAYTCTQHGLQAIVKHVTELRRAAEKTVEEIGQVRDLKVFVAMLLKLKSQLDKVTKSEPLRKLSVQIHYKKHFRSKEEEATDPKVLFVPQLYASQAFCSDHIEQLAAHVQEKLPAFDMEESSMESLIRNRKTILSAMIRLKALNKIVGNCAGGEKATSAYNETFQQFYALVESILALAEDSFKPPMDMRVFELQTWFLSVLVKGFIKDKIDVDSEERKQMEELESRRRLLMVRFEVQITDAIELLSDEEYLREEDDEDVKVNVTSEMIQNTDFTGFTEPRTMLVDLCHRPELFKMVLRQTTIQDLEKSIKSFDVALVKHLGAMIQCVEAGYQELLEMAKPGGGLRYILQRAMPLLKDCDKIQEGIDVSRSWSADFVNETMHHQRKLQIIRKRIEIAAEKLDAAIQSEAEISFASFMKDLAAHAFVCDGKWHEDRPGAFIAQK